MAYSVAVDSWKSFPEELYTVTVQDEETRGINLRQKAQCSLADELSVTRRPSIVIGWGTNSSRWRAAVIGWLAREPGRHKLRFWSCLGHEWSFVPFHLCPILACLYFISIVLFNLMGTLFHLSVKLSLISNFSTFHSSLCYVRKSSSISIYSWHFLSFYNRYHLRHPRHYLCHPWNSAHALFSLPFYFYVINRYLHSLCCSFLQILVRLDLFFSLSKILSKQLLPSLSYTIY